MFEIFVMKKQSLRYQPNSAYCDRLIIHERPNMREYSRIWVYVRGCVCAHVQVRAQERVCTLKYFNGRERDYYDYNIN